MLPKPVRLILLKLYNNMWQTGIFPPECNHAILVPILKHGKPSNQTDCTYSLLNENNGKNCRQKITMVFRKARRSIQNGFRKGRNTTLNTTHLENEVQKSLNTKGEALAIFVDLLKA